MKEMGDPPCDGTDGQVPVDSFKRCEEAVDKLRPLHHARLTGVQDVAVEAKSDKLFYPGGCYYYNDAHDSSDGKEHGTNKPSDGLVYYNHLEDGDAGVSQKLSSPICMIWLKEEGSGEPTF